MIHGNFQDVYDYQRMIELDANKEVGTKRILPTAETPKQKVLGKNIHKRGCVRGK